MTLQRRHNGCDSVSNHQPDDCLLYRLFRRRSMKTSNSVSLAFALWIHRWPVNSLHKWLVTRQMFPCHDVIMILLVILRKIGWDVDLTRNRQPVALTEFNWLPNAYTFLARSLANSFGCSSYLACKLIKGHKCLLGLVSTLSLQVLSE